MAASIKDAPLPRAAQARDADSARRAPVRALDETFATRRSLRRLQMPWRRRPTPPHDAPPAKDKRGTVWLVIAGLALALVLGGPLLARMGATSMTAVGVSMVGAVMGLVASVGGLMRWLRSRRRRALISAVLGALAFTPLLVALVMVLDAPSINDVTTDVEQPPRFIEAALRHGQPLEYPSAFADEALDGVEPLITPIPVEVVTENALEVARLSGWTIISAETSPSWGRFEAVATTPLFLFADDVVVRVTQVQAPARAEHLSRWTRVDVRSRSRAGRNDLGANRSRIQDFLDDLAARLR